MAHNTDVVREIVTDLDRIIGAVQRVSDRSATADRRELALAVVKLQESRFWLQEAGGHAGHFDTPEPMETLAAK